MEHLRKWKSTFTGASAVSIHSRAVWYQLVRFMFPCPIEDRLGRHVARFWGWGAKYNLRGRDYLFSLYVWNKFVY